MALLTDQTLASGVTLNDLIHIVITGDTSQNAAGSSYKAKVEQVAVAIGTAAFSGGTVIYPTTFVSGLTANTFYATTYLNLPGSSSGNCLSDLYVGSIHSCSPLYINPFDEGNVYFGSNGKLTIDLTNGRVGINTLNPNQPLDVSGNTLIHSGLTASTLNLSTTPNTQTSVPTNHLTRDDSTGEIKVDLAPGPINYGLFSQTGNSVVISATTTESTLIDGGVGTLTVPANSFKIGDSFRVVMCGVMSAGNGQTLQIKTKTDSIVLGDSGIQTLPSISNDVWTLNLDFTIRMTGGTGVASIISIGHFNYNKVAGGTQEGFSFSSLNNTTFDTTISNTLNVTAQWGSTSSSNSISTDFFNLNKTY